jgi:hypothetical protein
MRIVDISHHKILPAGGSLKSLPEADQYIFLLRSCLETPASNQAIQHNAGHGDVNPGFVGESETLIAFAEAA